MENAIFVGKGLPVRPGMCPAEAIKKLAALGFEPLGNGMAAYAMGRGDRVVKVSCPDAGHRAGVDAFIAHPEIESFPVIYGFVELAEGCFAYETELLEGELGQGGFYAYDGEAYLNGREDDWNVDAFVCDCGEDALRALLAFSPGGRDQFLDLHNGNVMGRSDGTAVVIDPFHTWEGPNGEETASSLGKMGTAYKGSFRKPIRTDQTNY